MMDRRTFLRSSTPGVATMSPQAAVPAQAAAGRLNVIWLLADQHRAQALSSNGDPNARTPNIDALSQLGVNFTGAVSRFPLRYPFRGSLLTGRYPQNGVPANERPLPAGQETIAAPFKDAGYQTAYFGKWYLDGFHEREGRAAVHIVPPERRGGFDVWAAYENNNSQWDSWVHGGAGKDTFHYRLPDYETDALSNLLIAYIKEHREEAKRGSARPYFAVLSVQPPHDPYVAPSEFMGRYNGAQLQLRPNVPPAAAVQETARRELAGYYAMVENWDWNIGRIRTALSETGLAFNTHLLVFSDHGDMHGSHGQYRKRMPYEESIRIPFIIGGEQPRYDSRQTGRFAVPLNHIDIAPTTLDLCGIRKPEWMEGFDYSHYRIPKQAPARQPDSAFLQCLIPRDNPVLNKAWRGIVTRDGWKYACFESTSWVMFNLNEDPYELVNLAHSPTHREPQRKLIARLRQWIADTGDSFPVPED